MTARSLYAASHEKWPFRVAKPRSRKVGRLVKVVRQKFDRGIRRHLEQTLGEAVDADHLRCGLSERGAGPDRVDRGARPARRRVGAEVVELVEELQAVDEVVLVRNRLALVRSPLRMRRRR